VGKRKGVGGEQNMTTKIDENGNVWISSANKYQEALHYAHQARKPDGGISARQIKASLSRKTEAKEVKKDEANQL